LFLALGTTYVEIVPRDGVIRVEDYTAGVAAAMQAYAQPDLREERAELVTGFRGQEGSGWHCRLAPVAGAWSADSAAGAGKPASVVIFAGAGIPRQKRVAVVVTRPHAARRRRAGCGRWRRVNDHTRSLSSDERRACRGC